MPYLNSDLKAGKCDDEDHGTYLRCDICKKVEECTDEHFNVKFHIWKPAWRGRSMPETGILCLACMKRVTPLVCITLRDIDELNLHINKLRKAINEKRRAENDGAASGNAG